MQALWLDAVNVDDYSMEKCVGWRGIEGWSQAVVVVFLKHHSFDVTT